MESTPVIPFLSVIIATYNRAESLRRAIQSVLAEPGDYFEVIVGDDGSPDHTPEVVQSFTGEPRLRYYRNAVNLGMQENYLKIAREAHGDYLFILTDDDWLVPGALERARQVLIANADIGYMLSHLPTVDERINHVVGIHRSYPTSHRLMPTLDNMAYLVGSAWVLSRQVLKRDLIDWATWEKFRDNIFFPIIFAGRLLLQAPAYYLAEPLVMHTWFNKVFWHAFGAGQLEIDFNLAVHRYLCMRSILHDYDMTPQVQAIITDWELDCFKQYLYPEYSGFYDAIKQLGLRPALAQLQQGFRIGPRERVELGWFFIQLPFRRSWVGLKSIARRLAPNLFYKLKALKDRTSA
jgi:glycosyltransferase involved in cell wall biosynthesis